MKKKFLHTMWLVLAVFVIAANAVAQVNVNMPQNGAGPLQTINPPATCFFNFFDSGGPINNYNSTADANITFAPSNPATHRIRVNFNSFNVESTWDVLYIYNGTSTAINQLTGPDPATNSGFPAGGWSATSPTTITANTGIAAVGANAAEALTFRFRSDPTVTFPGWTASVVQVPKVVCSLIAPANISNANTVSNDCTANVLTATPTFSPGGCNTSFLLQYRINGGAAVSVNAPIPATVTLMNVPKGSNVVTWELVDDCGTVLSSAVQSVGVVDLVPPSITCPPSVTLNLAAGECTMGYNFVVNCADNCPFPTNGTVSHPIDFDNGNDGIMFNVTNLSAVPIALTQFGPSLIPGTWNMRVYYTTNASTWVGFDQNPAAWTFAGSQLVTSVGNSPGTAVNGFNIPLAPGQSRGIYLTATAGQPLNYTGVNAGIQRQFDDGILRVSSTPGAGKGFPFAATFVSRAYNGYVKYASTASSDAQQISGLESNSEFPIGTTTNVFQCTDASGNTSTCSFNVTVLEYPNPISTLVCNDFLIVALGPDCTIAMNADQVLEGGPYKCYDHYLVQIDKVPPFGNGPWVPAVLGPADINKTYGVRVLDPTSGNHCEGLIQVKDNLPPPIVCNDIDVPCSFTDFNTVPTYSQTLSLTNIYVPETALPKSVLDFQTIQLNFQVNAPANATANDIDLSTVITGDAFNSNLYIELESPAGTVVNLWNQVGGCSPSPIFVTFDDEGTGGFSCPNYVNGTHAKIPFNVGALSAFDGENVNGTWKLRVTDIDGFGDVSIITLAKLHINLTGTYTSGFPNGFSANQLTQISPNSFLVPSPLLDNCSDVTLSYTDQTDVKDCTSPYSAVINRTWSAKDASNNFTTCTQHINLLRPSLDDVVLPPNYDDIDEQAFECGIPYPTPDWIENEGFQGFPYVFGLPIGCSITWTYSDAVIQLNDGTYTINRTWTIVDYCTSQTIVFHQIIKVIDTQGPDIQCPADLTVTTDVYKCCASVNLPDVIIEDECSGVNNIQATVIVHDQYTDAVIATYFIAGAVSNFPGNNFNDPDTLGILGTTPCLPLGTHTVIYRAIDGSGIESTCVFNLTVKDYTPPVAACDEFTVVAIGPDDPTDCYEPSNGCEFGGVTWVRATTFDDGSYDNCGFIKFKVRRALPYSDCITGLNHQNGAQPCNDGFPDQDSEYDVATQESDSIKFYCCEVGTSLHVILRVYQLDPLGDYSIGPDGSYIYNECVVEVSVQDKLKPGCIPPANTTVSCENFDPSLWAYGAPQVLDNCCLDTSYMLMGQKGLTQSATYVNFDSVCSKGTIVRKFQVYDCHGLTNSCTQRIVVNYEQDYFVKFPDDKMITFCDSTGVYDAPIFSGKDCELMGVSYTDQVFTVVPDACYKVERTWTIINWCTYDPNLPCINVPNPNPNATTNHPSNLPGPIVSAPGTVGAWAPTVVKVKPSDFSATNYSIYWDANANCYQYKQIIKIIDGQAPVFDNCPATPLEFCDLTTNDPLFWNELYWWDADLQTHDLCEGAADLNVTASDACSGTNVDIRYILFLDIDGDGTMETVVSSSNPPAPGTVNYNNVNSQNFTGGTTRYFDERAVPEVQKYRFALQTTTIGNKKIGSVRWNTQQSPGTYTLPQLPYGTHKIKWIVSDGCGNETVCEYKFIIKDCKAPTVLCLNGLTVNNMQTGMVTLYVNDFLQMAQDNCTPSNHLILGIVKSSESTGVFPVDGDGNPVTSVTFTCAELGTQAVQIWAMDADGNADFCETYVIVQDNTGACSQTQTASVAGALKTEYDQGLEEGSVQLEGNHPALPPVSMLHLSDNAGHYMFAKVLPMAANYTVTPTCDDNPLNGVTTYDLVKMSKYILGIDTILTPYQIIAADINRSGSVSTYDIVELRKLILGLYTELPANSSWRFVDKSYVFPIPSNPFFSAFPESKSVADIVSDHMTDDFVAIKVGDLNGSALPNSLVHADERAAGTALFDVQDRDLRAGEAFDLTFQSAEALQGFQFTLNTSGLKVEDIVEEGTVGTPNFGLFEDAVTVSINGAGGFTLKCRATKAGRLSEMVALSSRITKAEAYCTETDDCEGLSKDVALRFNSPDGAVVSGVGFELYQNIPNPFAGKTLIGFHLPKATQATLTIYDETGRLIHTERGDFAAGYNTLTVDSRTLGATAGLLRYTLRTPTDSATRSMIRNQ